MTQNQELKMTLLDKFGVIDDPKTVSFCREAYKFLTEDESKEAPQAPVSFLQKYCKNERDGIYLVYEDGAYTKYALNLVNKGVKYIGIIHYGHPFCVALKDAGRFSLIKKGVECEEESEFYVESETEVLHDWECVERTKRIQELGTDIPLNEGEYIPALPMVVAMRYWKNRGLDEALIAVGGEPLQNDSYYWSVTEYSANYAWNVHFGSGVVNGYSSKYDTYYVVRPVAAFNL